MIMDNNNAWNYAVGMVQLDGNKPSAEMLDLIEQEKQGIITDDDIRQKLIDKYKKG